MIVWIYALISVVVVSLISLIGVVTLPIKESRMKNFLLYLVSFSAGAFLGDIFIHLLPEIAEETGFTLQVSGYLLAGVLVSFLVEKIIHFRHSQDQTAGTHYHPSAIMSLVGDAVHNFIDGLIIAASYLISVPIGLATTFAVVFHEIPQEIGNFGVLLHGGFSKMRALLFNLLTALTAIVGVVIALFIGESSTQATAFLIPFATGNFIYIAGTDLIPELHKEVSFKKSVIQFFFLILGIAFMALLLMLE